MEVSRRERERMLRLAVEIERRGSAAELPRACRSRAPAAPWPATEIVEQVGDLASPGSDGASAGEGEGRD
jgi:hypothetical protein